MASNVGGMYQKEKWERFSENLGRLSLYNIAVKGGGSPQREAENLTKLEVLDYLHHNFRTNWDLEEYVRKGRGFSLNLMGIPMDGSEADRKGLPGRRVRVKIAPYVEPQHPNWVTH